MAAEAEPVAVIEPEPPVMPAAAAETVPVAVTPAAEAWAQICEVSTCARCPASHLRLGDLRTSEERSESQDARPGRSRGHCPTSSCRSLHPPRHSTGQSDSVRHCCTGQLGH